MAKKKDKIILTQKKVEVVQKKVKDMISSGTMLPLTKESASSNLKKLIEWAEDAEINE